MKLVRSVLLVVCGCIVLTPLFAQSHYTVIDLGALGGSTSSAAGIGNGGWAEGFAILAGGESHCFSWHNNNVQDLGTLGGPSSSCYYYPNYYGDVAGGSETSATDPNAEDFCGFGDDSGLACSAFFWNSRTKKMTTLPTLGGTNAYAASVNDYNQVAGEAETSHYEPACDGTGQSLQFEPVVWSNGHASKLSNYRGDPDGDATGLNDFGQVIGWSGPCFTPAHALLWQNGNVSPKNLGNLGGTQTQPSSINNYGQVVGVGNISGDQHHHGFLWSNNHITDLGTLAGDTDSEADGINDWGQVAGGSLDANGNARAFIWQNGKMTDMNTLIPANSPLYLIWASGGINDSGWIAGTALVVATGELHAFVAFPSR